MMSKRRSVSAIERGTVIDHIPAGMGLEVMKLLKLERHSSCVLIGLSLDSASHGHKDLIKIEDRELSPEEANHIALLAPEASISIIEDFEVLRKFKVALPDEIHDSVPCINARCITRHEPVQTRYRVRLRGQLAELRCHFCRQSQSIHPVITQGSRS